jgi:hypothetical protein
MSGNWTPGPWVDATFADDEGELVGLVAPSDVPFSERSWIDYGTGYFLAQGVCFEIKSDGYRSDKETIANARLIAAAPDLYAALSALMAHRPDHGDTLWQNADDALRKARGEIMTAHPAPASRPREGSAFCTVCALTTQPKGQPCKLCGRTEAPERKD